MSSFFGRMASATNRMTRAAADAYKYTPLSDGNGGTITHKPYTVTTGTRGAAEEPAAARTLDKYPIQYKMLTDFVKFIGCPDPEMLNDLKREEAKHEDQTIVAYFKKHVREKAYDFLNATTVPGGEEPVMTESQVGGILEDAIEKTSFKTPAEKQLALEAIKHLKIYFTLAFGTLDQNKDVFSRYIVGGKTAERQAQLGKAFANNLVASMHNQESTIRDATTNTDRKIVVTKELVALETSLRKLWHASDPSQACGGVKLLDESKTATVTQHGLRAAPAHEERREGTLPTPSTPAADDNSPLALLNAATKILDTRMPKDNEVTGQQKPEIIAAYKQMRDKLAEVKETEGLDPVLKGSIEDVIRKIDGHIRNLTGPTAAEIAATAAARAKEKQDDIMNRALSALYHDGESGNDTGATQSVLAKATDDISVADLQTLAREKTAINDKAGDANRSLAAAVARGQSEVLGAEHKVSEKTAGEIEKFKKDLADFKELERQLDVKTQLAQRHLANGSGDATASLVMQDGNLERYSADAAKYDDAKENLRVAEENSRAARAKPRDQELSSEEQTLIDKYKTAKAEFEKADLAKNRMDAAKAVTEHDADVIRTAAQLPTAAGTEGPYTRQQRGVIFKAYQDAIDAVDPSAGPVTPNQVNAIIDKERNSNLHAATHAVVDFIKGQPEDDYPKAAREKKAVFNGADPDQDSDLTDMFYGKVKDYRATDKGETAYKKAALLADKIIAGKLLTDTDVDWAVAQLRADQGIDASTAMKVYNRDDLINYIFIKKMYPKKKPAPAAPTP